MKKIIEKMGDGFFRNRSRISSLPGASGCGGMAWKRGIMPAVILGLAAPLFATPSFFRIVSSDNEVSRMAVKELTAYYEKSPGFKSAAIIAVDTLALNEWSNPKRAQAASIQGTKEMALTRHDERVLESPVSEWKSNAGEGDLDLMRIQGRFHGFYHKNGLHHSISPYLFEGVWMTMMLVYDKHAPQCGTNVRTHKISEEAK